VLVPTNYFTTPTDEFRKNSTSFTIHADVSMVIWANHNVRAAVKAMQDTTKAIYQTQSL
jgi:phosphoenolpyruvate phosphomutase